MKAWTSVHLVYRCLEGEFDYNLAVRLVYTWETDRDGYSQTQCFNAAVFVWRDGHGIRQFAAEFLKENQSDSLHLKNETVKTTNELTTFAEAVPEAGGFSGSQVGLHRMGHPYPDAELTRVLSRKYLIASTTWDDTDVAGDALAAYDIMSLLLAVPNIADKLTQFRWLAANARIEVKVNATPMHIGALLVSHIPRVKGASPALQQWGGTLAQLSQNHGVVLSASTVNNVELIVEREAPSLFDNVDTTVATAAGCLGLLTISVLNPLVLATAGTVSSVIVSVFASFENPVPAGYGWFPLTPLVAKLEGKSGFRQQSGIAKDPIQREAMSRASSSVVSGAEATQLYQSVVSEQPAGGVQDLLKQVGPAIQFMELVGMSKPTNQTTPVPVYNDEYRDQNYTHGVALATKFSRHPSAGLGSPHGCQLRKNKLTDFIMKPGLVYSGVITKEDEVGVPLFSTPVHPGISHLVAETGVNAYTPTPMGYAANAFLYWRGGVRFLIEFITSQFVTARVRITHWPSSALPPDLETHAGDAVSSVVDVRGDTSTAFTVPYVSPMPYQRCRGYTHMGTGGDTNYATEDKNSYLTMSLVNPLNQPDATQGAVIYYNIYVAAAADMTFINSVHPIPRPALGLPPAAVGFKQQSLVKRFDGDFAALVPATSIQEAGVVSTEQFTTIEELCMFYTTYVDATPTFVDAITTTLSYDDLDGNPITALDHLAFWAPCFRWNRGGLRYRFGVVPTSAWFAGLQDPVGGSIPSHFAVADTRFKGVTEFEVEWPLGVPVTSYRKSLVDSDDDITYPPWIPIWAPFSGSVDPAVPEWICRAAADDFMFGHQLAVPVYAQTPEEPPLRKRRLRPTTGLLDIEDIVRDTSSPRAGAVKAPKHVPSSSPVMIPRPVKTTEAEDKDVPPAPASSPVLDQSTGLSSSMAGRLIAFLEDKGKLPLIPKAKL